MRKTIDDIISPHRYTRHRHKRRRLPPEPPRPSKPPPLGAYIYAWVQLAIGVALLVYIVFK